MDDLTALRERLPGYPGYDDRASRHLADQEVRAALGEALAAARERLAPAAATLDALDALLLRCEFSDQRLVHSAEVAHLTDAAAAHAIALDRRVIELADRVAAAADATTLDAAIVDANQLFDARISALD
jgi:hypothetical protein